MVLSFVGEILSKIRQGVLQRNYKITKEPFRIKLRANKWVVRVSNTLEIDKLEILHFSC